MANNHNLFNVRSLRTTLAVIAILLASSVVQAWSLKLADEISQDDLNQRGPRAFSLLAKQGTPVHEEMLYHVLGCEYPQPCTTGFEDSTGITMPMLLRGLRWPDNPAFIITKGFIGSECKNIVLRPGHPGDRSDRTTISCW